MTDPGPASEHHPVPEQASDRQVARAAQSRIGAVFGWLFRSRRTGRITIAQFPNFWLWVFLVTIALRWVVPTGTWVRTAVNWIAVISLGVWALDEVLRGANPWRRALGFGVGGLVIAGAVSMVR